MYSAPAVNYPVGRFHMERRFASWLWLAAGLLWLSGTWGMAPLQLPHYLFLMAWLLLAPVVWRGSRDANSASLNWDGLHWHWKTTQDACLAIPGARFDGQAWVLLQIKLRTGARVRSRWILLKRADDPALWRDLRRALFADGAP